MARFSSRRGPEGRTSGVLLRLRQRAVSRLLPGVGGCGAARASSNPFSIARCRYRPDRESLRGYRAMVELYKDRIDVPAIIFPGPDNVSMHHLRTVGPPCANIEVVIATPSHSVHTVYRGTVAILQPVFLAIDAWQ